MVDPQLTDLKWILPYHYVQASNTVIMQPHYTHTHNYAFNTDAHALRLPRTGSFGDRAQEAGLALHPVSLLQTGRALPSSF